MYRFSLASLIVLCVAATAWAHPGHGEHTAAAGLLHPWLGLDHVLAMIAVGMLAFRLGGRGLWLAPAAFILSMMTGGALTLNGLAPVSMEYTVLLSVIALGLILAASHRVPLPAVVIVICGFGLFHGCAHFAALPAGGTWMSYSAGLLGGTIALHLLGIAGGWLLYKAGRRAAFRVAGYGIAAVGLLLCLV